MLTDYTRRNSTQVIVIEHKIIKDITLISTEFFYSFEKTHMKSPTYPAYISYLIS